MQFIEKPQTRGNQNLQKASFADKTFLVLTVATSGGGGGYVQRPPVLPRQKIERFAHYFRLLTENCGKEPHLYVWLPASCSCSLMIINEEPIRF